MATPVDGARIAPEEILTANEVRALISACSARSSTGLRNRALIVVLYRSGLRLGEALQLEAGQVDLESRTVRGATRGERVRSIGLDAGSFRVIERWLERRAELGLQADAPLFCTLSGKVLASSYLRGLLHRLAEKAKVDKQVSAEVLRRSLAVELVKEGFPIETIQSQLGHSAASVTGRYLARLAAADPTVVDVSRRRDWLA